MGGLTTALSLARAGFKDIQIYEMAPNIGFVGAGLQLSPNMARILDGLGVWKDIEREAVFIDDTHVIGWFRSHGRQALLDIDCPCRCRD